MTYPAGDHLECVNILHKYTQSVDKKDFQAVRSTFHADAKIAAFGAELSVDDYADSIAGVTEKMTTIHIIANEYVEINGDRATVSSYVYTLHTVPANLGHPGADAIFGAVDKPTDSLIFGRYFDTLERRNGTWKVIRKEISLVSQQHLATMPPFPGWANM